MQHYEMKRVSKAEKLENWVQKLTEKTNKGLVGAKIHSVSVHFTPPHFVRGKEYYEGYLWLHMKFDKNEPEFIGESDRQEWCPYIKKLAINRFSIDSIAEKKIHSTNIAFEESSANKFYALTQNKKTKIIDGFNRIKRFVEWYCYAVEEYEKLAQVHKKSLKEHLSNLETISLQN